jgi:putative ABC transport system substrate-binding protein
VFEGQPVRRRDFITLVGGAAAGWPLAVRAQQPERMRHVSVLMAYVESDATQLWKKVFSESLQELGWIVGRNMQLDFHWPGPSSQDLLRADAAEMVHLNPDVLIAVTTPAVVALQHETRSIPIVFVSRP